MQPQGATCHPDRRALPAPGLRRFDKISRNTRHLTVCIDGDVHRGRCTGLVSGNSHGGRQATPKLPLSGEASSILSRAAPQNALASVTRHPSVRGFTAFPPHETPPLARCPFLPRQPRHRPRAGARRRKSGRRAACAAGHRPVARYFERGTLAA